MKAEVLAVQKMTNGMKSSGMAEAQALAVVEAIAEGLQAFALTREDIREVVREELVPIHQRLDNLEARMGRVEARMGRVEVRMDLLESRMFYLMLAMIGAMISMFGSMFAMFFSGSP